MVGAMLVLVVAVVGLVTVRELTRTEPEAPVRAVEYERAAELAREQAPFRVLAPEPLPEGWRVTSVRFVEQPAHWHLGQLTDDNRYVGLEQADRSVAAMVEDHVDEEATRAGTVTVEGDPWQVWTDAGGDTAVVRRAEGVTTLVVGTVGRATLADYVTNLR